MISPETKAHILRLFYAEHWLVGTIANQLGLHHSTVEGVLFGTTAEGARSVRASIATPYLPFMQETLQKYPKLPATRLHEMVKERGYPGGVRHFRKIVATIRPRPAAEAYLRLKTLPGEQAQVDWAYFGKVEVEGTERPLWGFVMVLSYSRAVFLRFSFGARMAHFLEGHVEAFRFFEGVARVLLYDNLKSAVLERSGDAIRFQPTLLDFAGHYRYEVRPVAVARGNEKGRVERAIGYARTSFFPARPWTNLKDWNEQALTWCRTIAMARAWPEDTKITVGEALEKERPSLLPQPDDDFPANECLEVRVGKTPYVRFDLNDYSVPHELVRRTLVVSATADTVRVIHGDTVVATHRRSYGRRRQIEDERHIADLAKEKREAREHRGMNRLTKAAPRSEELLQHLAERGANLGNATVTLVGLLDAYGAEELDLAIAEALTRGVPHPHAVRHILERRRQDQGLPAALPLPLPDNPRVRDLTVKPHDLESYDTLKKEESGDDETAVPV